MAAARIIPDMTKDGMEVQIGDFVRTWALESSLNVGLMWGDTKYSWNETYTHERDAFPNFINSGVGASSGSHVS